MLTEAAIEFELKQTKKTSSRNCTMSIFEEHNEAYGRAVANPDFECLYKKFPEALFILRHARNSGQLVTNGDDDDRALREFYERLILVGRYLDDASPPWKAVAQNPPFIIAVEGLDGSGKSEFTIRLARALSNNYDNNNSSNSKKIKGMTMSTPPESMSRVRDIFDKRGGPVARAFYMASNYVLLYDIWEEIQSSNDASITRVIVVDRWYTSTCAYTIGYKNTSGGEERIDALESSIFAWPIDLLSPDLIVLLSVDDQVRKGRVNKRAAAAIAEAAKNGRSIKNHNPWDERLSNDPSLGKRIFRALERIARPFDTLLLDANKSREHVLDDALAAIQPKVHRHVDPAAYYKHQPLEFFVWASARLGFCDAKTGRRGKHQPWAVQLALNRSDGTLGAPPLRSVGIHTVNEAGILFFSSGGHPGGAMGGDNQGLASIVWCGGHYPYEQQWRSEGILKEVSSSECQFMGEFPPASLVGNILACRALESIASNSPNDKRRMTCTLEHSELVRTGRLCDEATLWKALDDKVICATRFIPLRIEVLVGGPSSPGGPHRYEWNRVSDSPSDKSGWAEARLILPFTMPGSIAGPQLQSTQLRPVTVALTGTHCSGKSTVALRLASVMKWELQRELGDILRKAVPANGHREGYATEANDKLGWDDRIHSEEISRDEATSYSRVVETWHIGNLGWALLRKKTQAAESNGNEMEKHALTERAKEAVQKHCKVAVPILVHLHTSPESTLRRRQKDAQNRRRIPMEHEEPECNELHEILDACVMKHLEALNDMGIPTLVVDNSHDGQQDTTTAKIIKFIQSNTWRCMEFSLQ